MQKIGIFLHKYYNILLIFLGIFIFFTFKALNFNGLYGQDAYEYYNYANELRLFWQKGANIGECHYPIFYPLISSFFALILPLAVVMQSISITCFMLVFYFLKKIIHILYPDLQFVSTYLFLLGILSPYFFRLGICIMSDMLAISAVSGLLFYSLAFLQKNELKHFTMALLCAFIAVMTRYASILVVFFPILTMIYHAYKHHFLSKILPIFLLLLPLILPFIYLKKSYLQGLMSHPAYTDWSFFYFFQSHFDLKGDGFHQYSVPNFVYGTLHYLHPAYLLLSPILLFFIRKKDFQIPLFFFFSAAIYALFLMGFPTQNTRLQTFMMPFMLILFAPSFSRMCDYFSLLQKDKFAYLFLLFLSFFSLLLIYFSTKSIRHFNQTEKYISLKINEINAPSLYTLGIEGALKANQVQVPIHSLFEETVDSVENGTLFLLPSNFAAHWQGHSAMKSWLFVKTHYHTKIVFPLPDEWEIWQIEGKKENPKP